MKWTRHQIKAYFSGVQVKKEEPEPGQGQRWKYGNSLVTTNKCITLNGVWCKDLARYGHNMAATAMKSLAPNQKLKNNYKLLV